MLHYGFVQVGNPLNIERVTLEGLGGGKDVKIRKIEHLKRLYDNGLVLYHNVHAFDILHAFRILSEVKERVTDHFFNNTWSRARLAAELCLQTIDLELGKGLPIAEEYRMLFGKMNENYKHLAAARYRIERKVTLHKNRQFCEGFLNQVLPCIPVHGTMRPKVFNMASSLVEKKP